MTIEIFSRRGLLGRRWYFRVRASNGKVVAQSEAYSRRIDAVATVQSLKAGLSSAEVTDA